MEFNYKVGGRKMTKLEFIKNLTPVYAESMTPKQIRGGFERTGIYPPNRNATKISLMSLPSHVTDKLCKFQAIQV